MNLQFMRDIWRESTTSLCLFFYSTYFYFNISDNQSRKKILEEFQSQAREELLTPLEEEMEAKYNVRINW